MLTINEPQKEVFMGKIVIFVSRTYINEWSSWETWCKKFNIQSQSLQVNNTGVQYLRIVDSNQNELIIVNPDDLSINSYSNVLSNLQIQNQCIDFLFLHLSGGDAQEVAKSLNIQNYAYYSHAPATSVWKMFEQVWDVNIDQGIKIILQWISRKYPSYKKKLQDEIYLKNFTLLFHRIAHLFLPLFIDMEGLKEVYENDPAKAEDYLKKIVKGKTSNHYQTLLANFRYSIVGSSGHEIPGNGGKPIEAEDEFKQQINTSTFEEVLQNVVDKEDKDKYLEVLKNLAGLKNGEEIIKFMKQLDSVVEVGEANIDEGHVETFVNFKFNNQQLTLPNGKEISSFKDWYCALQEVLLQILEKLK